MEQADLTLVVADCAHLPPDAQRAAASLQSYLRGVLPSQEHTGMMTSWPPRRLPASSGL